MARKNPLVNLVDVPLVADVDARLRTSVALPFARLTAVKLTPAARHELVKRLVDRGFECTPKLLRIPLAQQILALVDGGARVLRKDLIRLVKGASKREIDGVLAKLILAKRIHIVVRSKAEIIVGAGEVVLGSSVKQELTKVITSFANTLKTMQSRGLSKTLLREDLDALLDSLTLVTKSVKTNGATAGEFAGEGAQRFGRAVVDSKAPVELVLETLRQLEEPNLKLVRVADLVRKLAPRVTKDDVHRALTKSFEMGTIELRPDGGTEFLKEDGELCLPGPRGTVFAYARRLSL